ncbi:NAD(P)H-binding protein [Nonomuraea antimicrobica]
MSISSILVTGGTGKTGRRVAALLDRRGVPARVASRSGSVRFDWTDETTWDPALAGVRAVYLVDSQDVGAAAEVRAFTERAVARGVDRLVLLSARVWAEMGDPAGLAVEKAVREAGVAWTILRPSWFAQNFGEDPLIAGAMAGEICGFPPVRDKSRSSTPRTSPRSRSPPSPGTVIPGRSTSCPVQER